MSEYEPSAEEQAHDEARAEAEAEYHDWLAGIADGRLYRYVMQEDGREPTNIADAMRGKVEPPELLVPDWIVKGVLHWMYSDAEAGKTWVALRVALDVIRQGRIVLWVDEELGDLEIARRLTALGATAEEVEHLFVYYPFPGWQWTDHDRASWLLLVSRLRPALVVFDTATDMLTEADLDENAGKDVTAWVKEYCEPPTRVGAATLVLDHTGKSDGGSPGKHAVGSRGKRAKAKVQWALSSKERYDRTSLGRIEVALTKNTLGAELPTKSRTFKVGGDGEGNFIFEQTANDSGDAGKARRAQIIDFLQARPGTTFSQNQLVQLIDGPAPKVKADLKYLANKDGAPVKAEPGPRRSIMYSYDDTLLSQAAALVAAGRDE